MDERSDGEGFGITRTRTTTSHYFTGHTPSTPTLCRNVIKVRTVSKLGYARRNVLLSSDRQNIRKNVIKVVW